MTDEQITAAVQEGVRTGVSGVAAAFRSGAQSAPLALQRQPKQHSPLLIAATVVGMIVPFGGGVGWVMSLSSRVSVAESRLSSVETKQASIDDATNQLAALKQELTDFRGEFRDWKRDNGNTAPHSTQDR